MDLTRALKDVRFDLVMRGYDCDAVDAFLAKARGEVAELVTQRDSARSRVDELEGSGSETDAEGTLRRTLVLAQRLADETVADAKQTAEAMVEAATTEASTTKEQARAEADSILSEANEEAADSRTKARQELERATEDAARVSEESAVAAQTARDEATAGAEVILVEAERSGQARVVELEEEAKAEVARMREPIRSEITQLEETRASLLRDIEALEEHLGEQRVRVRTAVESLRAGMSGSIDDLERVAADEDAMSLAARPVLENSAAAAVDEAPDVDIIESVNEHTDDAPDAELIAAAAMDAAADSGLDDAADATVATVLEADPVVVDDAGPATEPIPVVDLDQAAEQVHDVADSIDEPVVLEDAPGAPEDAAVAEVVDLDSAPSAIFGTDVTGTEAVVDADLIDVEEVATADEIAELVDVDDAVEVDTEVVNDDDDRPFLERFTAAIGELPIQRGR